MWRVILILVLFLSLNTSFSQTVIEMASPLDANIILVWGSEAEHKDALFIKNNTKNTQVSPKLSLTQLTALIDSVDLIIGNDTGPTHIAWAMNKASITLFGPTPASKMMWETKLNISIESESVVNPLKLNRSDMSIKEILPESIYEKAKGLL